VTVAPLNPEEHSKTLYAGTHGAGQARIWAYMGDGPFEDLPAFNRALAHKAESEDPLFFAILDRASGTAVGYASYLRIEPAHRVIEVGNIVYTRSLQRTAGATEAMFLMARHVFEDLGYRRYEWKCNSLHERSRRAALRLGFTFEGLFRQHMIIKGRNRDTAWYSMLDGEWPERRTRFERWLAPANFDAAGRQKAALSEMTCA
jgi:RimJ/RimL family protein N-acetyltransferase